MCVNIVTNNIGLYIYIMQCQGFISEISIFWGNILDQVTCSANEAKIMNLGH